MSRDITLVTDSTADIPADLVTQHEIHIVPNIMVVDGQSLEDGKGFSRQEFYERLPHMENLPTTANASSGAYLELYQMLLAGGARQIISIHAASNLSGIFNAARLAATEFAGKIHVVDSEQLSMGLGFQVLAAAEAVANGLPIEQVIERVHSARQRVRVLAMLETLDYARRSGRISWAKAQIGNLLNLKAFIEVKQGKILSLGEARTRHKAIERLKDMLLSQGPLEKLAMLHSNAEADARQIFQDVKHQLALSSPPLIVNITTIIGVYTGPNCLGFAAVLA